MQIIIEYESSWRNSFLDGSNNEPVPKGGRNFVASMTALKQDGNYKKRSVTKDTVMGILNRLIGDQQKLYRARLAPNYYFSEIEAIIQDTDIIDEPIISNEMAYIRNVSGSTDQNSFTGMIKDNHPTFKSDYSDEFWGILWLDKSELIEFILNDSYVVTSVTQAQLSSLTIAGKANELDKLKNIAQDEGILKAIEKLNTFFPNEAYIEKNESIKLVRLYAGAIYLQFERLKSKFNMETACNTRGENIFIYGFSKRGFNGSRDFMKNFITGKEKIIWGNPYLMTERKKGEGEVVSILAKASGKLTINLNISKEQARDLEEKIENAGVSSFYLGKKGLAYVTDIRV
ncbi:hypothetical protein D9K79_05945 [Acinetobacter cumulans]|uniref:Cas5fv helical domain-containing protein n=1 Tax=Acinetobacter cumulans TaxID=2136182 RepID=A0ABX9U8S1_9GAMM|nr:type I-Fv CRISPR-associated protein Cas5fv [Acinetobacter cumulans]RLL47513.1 hypothetical protein D9K79_05945 [Acinetobacter cumulans]